ncbi:complex I subunit 5 family protein [Myxococcota bacterium]|nr:complex I subunit 5 family protein [Myxococcota bacterium]
MLAVTAVVFAAALAWSLVEPDPGDRGRTLALTFLLQVGVSGAVVTADLFDFYVYFELMGVASYALVAGAGRREQVEASLKYAVLSLLSSALLVMGVGAVYAQTGVLSLAALGTAGAEVVSPPLYLFSVCMVLTGLALKAALVPLHFWLPDAHSVAPTAVSVLLSGVVVKVGAYGMLRVLAANPGWVGEAVRPTLLVLAASTAALAALVAVAQRDLKRLLAWSTASQMGYLVAAAALGTAGGLAAALLQLVAHALTKSTLFVMAGTAIRATGEREWARMGGLQGSSPLLPAAGLVAALSLAGLPPLAGFASKLAIFRAMVEARAWWTLTSLMLASALVVWLMARVWMGLFGGGGSAEGREGRRVPLRAGELAVAAVLAALVVVVGVAAEPVAHLARTAARGLVDGAAWRDAVLAPGPRGEGREAR